MKIPLALINDTRDTSRESDSWGVNCFIDQDGNLHAVKRPGILATVDVVDSDTGGQGIFIWPGTELKIVSIWDDVLFIHEIDPDLEELIWNSDPKDPPGNSDPDDPPGDPDPEDPPGNSGSEDTPEGIITTSFGWDFGDISDPSGVVDNPPYPVTFPLEPGPSAGWELLVDSTPISGINDSKSLQLLEGNLVIAYPGMPGNDLYSSADGISWDTGIEWPGPYYYRVAPGWYDGTYIKTAYGYGEFLQLSYTAQSLLGSGTLSAYWPDFNPLQTFIVGGNVYITYRSLSGSYMRLAKSAVSPINWTEYTSNLLKADVGGISAGYAIAVFGSIFYALPPGGGSGKKVYTSTDFVTWTLLTSDWGLGDSIIKQVARHAYTDKIVILLDNDNVATTTDGITWTKSNFIPVITGTFTPSSLCKFGSYWYTAGGSKWARLPDSRVP